MEEENNEPNMEERSDSTESSYLLNIDNHLKKDARIICAHLDMSLKDFFNLAIKDFVAKKQKELDSELCQK